MSRRRRTKTKGNKEDKRAFGHLTRCECNKLIWDELNDNLLLEFDEGMVAAGSKESDNNDDTIRSFSEPLNQLIEETKQRFVKQLASMLARLRRMISTSGFRLSSRQSRLGEKVCLGVESWLVDRQSCHSEIHSDDVTEAG